MVIFGVARISAILRSVRSRRSSNDFCGIADGGIPASGVVTGVWTVADASPTVVDGTLTFAEGASVSLANASLFANAGSRGIPIAVASGGIVGEPAMTNYNFELKLSGRIDLRGGSLDVTNLMGSPDVTNAAPFGVAGLWTVEDDTPMTVTGTLAFRSADSRADAPT